MQALLSTMPKEGNKTQLNSIPVTFNPTKAGDYPCKLLLLSQYDTRVLSFKGIGILFQIKQSKLSVEIRQNEDEKLYELSSF